MICLELRGKTRLISYENGHKAADVNKDGKKLAVDLTLLRRYILKKIDKF